MTPEQRKHYKGRGRPPKLDASGKPVVRRITPKPQREGYSAEEWDALSDSDQEEFAALFALDCRNQGLSDLNIAELIGLDRRKVPELIARYDQEG